tara:strand:- start:1402 stop:2097 length:696 start_codon:yes stop_codon:yes gene_type:complete
MTVIAGPSLVDTIDAADLGDVALTDQQKAEVVYSKYESQDPMLSDTQHGEKWDKQTITVEKLGVTEDMGCIIDLVGSSRGEVAIDRTGEVLTEEAADIREEASGQNIPRFMAYDFRIAKILKTDGPAQRQALQRTHEQQRAKSEENMFDTIARAMSQVGDANVAPSDSHVQNYLASLAPAQRIAAIEMATDQIEEVAAEQLAESNLTEAVQDVAEVVIEAVPAKSKAKSSK